MEFLLVFPIRVLPLHVSHTGVQRKSLEEVDDSLSVRGLYLFETATAVEIHGLDLDKRITIKSMSRLAVPHQCLCVVFLDTSTTLVHDSEIELRIGLTKLCRLQAPS